VKRFLVGLLALLFLCLPAQATNSTTDLGTLPVVIQGERYDAKMYLVAIDTTGTDQTIHTPASTNTACITGMYFLDSAAQDVSIKLNASVYITLKLAANQGVFDKMTGLGGICSVIGQPIKVKSSGTMATMLFYVIETPRLKFGGR
jgi:hypothetical protein